MATFYNQATLSYNGTVRQSNLVSGEVMEVLSASKTAVVSEYTQGGTVTYLVSLLNSGTTAFTNLTITDDLGTYSLGTNSYTPLTYTAGSVLYYVNGVLQSAPTVTAGPPLTISGIQVPAGGNATLVYEVTANQYAPLAEGSSITNTASTTGTGLAAPVTAQETITPENGPDLSISKSVSPTSVSENGQLTYTFQIVNNGNAPADAEDNAIVTDTFDPILTQITVSLNGDTVSSGVAYNYQSATGVFTTLGGAITVPAATYSQDTDTGVWSATPGITTMTVTGTVSSLTS